MRVVSWNMGYAFGYARSHDEAWRRLLYDLEPDVALVQEARPPDWVIETRSVVWRPEHSHTSRGTGVVAAGRALLGTRSVRHRWLPRLGGQVIVTEADTSAAENLLIASIHDQAKPVDPRIIDGEDVEGIKLQQANEIWPLDLIFDDLRRDAHRRRFVIGGDLNASLLLDSNYGPRGNAEFFERVADAGWIDCRATFYEDEQRTFFQPGKDPYQLDHVFVDAETADHLEAFIVLTDDKYLVLSDHAPVVVDIADLG